MIIICYDCDVRFDDEFRTTICPHRTFAANDGHNNFAHHPESYISVQAPDPNPFSSEITITREMTVREALDRWPNLREKL